MLARVAFIDCGISKDHLQSGDQLESCRADVSGVSSSDAHDEAGHGTLCYHVFNCFAKDCHTIIDIKLLDPKTDTGSHKALVTVLEWCKDQQLDVVNMSMGTRQFSDFAPITKAIRSLSPATVVVAAGSNGGWLGVPRRCDRS